MASYRFTLRTPDNLITFGSELVKNWQDIEPSLTENDTYKFIFREFTNTFEFVGFARELIIQAVDNHGYDAGIYLTIEVGNDNRERWSFEVIANELKADIQELEIGELYASLNFADSQFTAQIMDSDDKKTNIDVTESFTGVALPELVLEEIRCHDRTLIYANKGETLFDETSLTKGGLLFAFISYVFPITWDYSDDPNVKDVFGVNEAPIYGETFPFSFYFPSEKARQIKIDFAFDFSYSSRRGIYEWRVYLQHWKASGDNVLYELARSESYGGDPGVPIFQDMTTEWRSGHASFSDVLNIEEGDSLNLRFGGSPLTASYASEYYMRTENLNIEIISNEYFDATTSQCILPLELFERFIAIYTGVTENNFYSDFFGRIDRGYAVNGPGAYLTVQNGKMLRGFPFAECQFNTSLKEAFESFDAMYCLAGTIETIGGKDRFRIEPYKDLLNSSVVLKLGTMLAEVERRVNDKMIFSEIAVGYKELEFEEVNGLFNFAGEFNFVPPLQLEGQKLDIVSKWIVGDVAIELTRRNQYSLNPTKDYRFDKDIFIIDAKRLMEYINGEWVDTGFPLVPITNENYEIIEGIYEPTKAYNLNLSPKRNLLRWGWFIAGCLTAKQTSKIQYVSGSNNPNLITKKIDESTIIENADILVSDLDTPLILPDRFTIAEAELTKAQWDAISASKGGLIEFENKGIRLFGRVSEISFAINKKTANFELNRANY